MKRTYISVIVMVAFLWLSLGILAYHGAQQQKEIDSLRELVFKLQADVPPIAFQAAQSYEFLTLPIIERDGTETTLGVLLADLGVRSAW